MPLIVIDGPEKAGKSTLAKAIVAKYGGVIRAWGPVDPDDRVYAQPLMEDCASVAAGKTVVWDRSWASEHVYAKLLNRDRRLREDAWLGEWLYGRAVQTIGLRVMLLGESVERLVADRDATDLPVEPRDERDEFYRYALAHGWNKYVFPHTAKQLDAHVDIIWTSAVYSADRAWASPPAWAGPNLARTVYVGEARNGESTFPGSFLPFTSQMTIQFARMVPRPFEAGWTNAADCPPQALRYAKTIVACGTHAQKWAKFHVGDKAIRIINVAHPAFVFRYNTPAAQKAKREMARAMVALGNERTATEFMM
jgi:hypothetical protein